MRNLCYCNISEKRIFGISDPCLLYEVNRKMNFVFPELQLNSLYGQFSMKFFALKAGEGGG